MWNFNVCWQTLNQGVLWAWMTQLDLHEALDEVLGSSAFEAAWRPYKDSSEARCDLFFTYQGSICKPKWVLDCKQKF